MMSPQESSGQEICPWCGADRLFLEDTIARLEVEAQSLRGALREVAYGDPPPGAQMDATTWLRRRARFALGEAQTD